MKHQNPSRQGLRTRAMFAEIFCLKILWSLELA
jgi:hypothetical protein